MSTDRHTASFVLLVFAVTLALVTGTASIAAACGHCHGDKEAAVYDAAVLAKAKRDGNTVVYAEVTGAVPDDAETKAALWRAIASMPAVDQTSIKVSTMPTAVAFAFNPKKGKVTELLAAISKKFGTKQWSLKLLKIVN